MSRKLVTIRQIQSLTPIHKADLIELARIDGWKVVVQKGLHTVGDYVVYFEVDSVLPDTDFFRETAGRDGLTTSMLEDGTIVRGYLIRAIKLKGVVSQGLILPVSVIPSLLLPHDLEKSYKEQTDLTQMFKTSLYAKPFNPENAPDALGYMPTNIRRTAVERVQNQLEEVWQAYQEDWLFQVTCKLDGDSCTVFKHNGTLGVCSRNLNFKFDIQNKEQSSTFTRAAAQMHKKLPDVSEDYCIQGELVGPGIQQNFEKLDVCGFYVFSMWDLNKQEYLNPTEVEEFADLHYLHHVPVIHQSTTLKEMFGSVQDASALTDLIIAHAKGPSSFNGKYREGLVWKALIQDFSFKAISDQYITNEHNLQD